MCRWNYLETQCCLDVAVSLPTPSGCRTQEFWRGARACRTPQPPQDGSSCRALVSFLGTALQFHAKYIRSEPNPNHFPMLHKSQITHAFCGCILHLRRGRPFTVMTTNHPQAHKPTSTMLALPTKDTPGSLPSQPRPPTTPPLLTVPQWTSTSGPGAQRARRVVLALRRMHWRAQGVFRGREIKVYQATTSCSDHGWLSGTKLSRPDALKSYPVVRIDYKIMNVSNETRRKVKPFYV